MKSIIYRFASLMLILACLVSASIPAYAAEDDSSVETTSVVDLENGISCEYTVVPDQTRAYSYTSATVYGRFYLTASGDTVAKGQLKVYFKYDGSFVQAYSSTASCEPVAANWAISYGDTAYTSTGVNASGSAVFTLYYNGKYNNSMTAIVYCTKDGTTSTVIN